ncbi:MAG: sulfotransferase [Pseudomonadota bacterium]
MAQSKSSIQGHHQAALQALQRGQLKEAHQHCLEILKSDRMHADAWFICGVIAGRNKQAGKAIQILQNAVGLDPENAEYLAELAKFQLAEGHFAQALASGKDALDQEPHRIPVLNTLGALFSHCGDQERAAVCFKRATQRLENQPGKDASLEPNYIADLYFNLAASLKFTGDLSGAEDALLRSITILPHFFKAHWALSGLKRYTAGNNHLDRLLALRDEVGSPTDQLHLGHALAKEQEDLGQYAESLASLEWAKARAPGAADYSPQEDASLLRAASTAFDRPLKESDHAKRHDSHEPIFIVGMPRTGTTLLEQILGAHSQVFDAGELQNLPLLAKQLTGSTGPDQIDEQVLSQAAGLDMRQLGQAYIDSTRPRTGHTAHFIDKLPLNFLYLGLIRQALPNARLICLRRDPMDTCLSNYRQLFATQFRYYRYNLDLLNCGRYFIEFDRLIKHWKSLLGDALLEVHYEALVQDTQAQVAGLLEFCGLPFEQACLDFHTRNASVATPSATQIRRGVYSTSVGRWRHYGDALVPLRNLLGEAGYYD